MLHVEVKANVKVFEQKLYTYYLLITLYINKYISYAYNPKYSISVKISLGITILEIFATMIQ